jgi:aspartate/methionine/tyrosine aminotransferase
MRAEFRRRRDAIVAGLDDLPGVSCVLPRGAFYAFPTSPRRVARQARSPGGFSSMRESPSSQGQRLASAAKATFDSLMRTR